ncbi:9151_t:CDS:2 [Ambispora leptoticha]|uniref:9151_t:CDS:1 n=1 Tax=Ambispora leptoticha TaxID=144679 RepID=A0A9N9FVV9_9GLOM|nr:9151_t:CDS:2 [Ambispora leptoticha]
MEETTKTAFDVPNDNDTQSDTQEFKPDESTITREPKTRGIITSTQESSSLPIIEKEIDDKRSSSNIVEVNNKDLSSSFIVEVNDNNNENRPYAVKDTNVNESFDINLLCFDDKDEDTLLAGYEKGEIPKEDDKENYTDLLGFFDGIINSNDNIEDVKNQDYAIAMNSQTDLLIDLGDDEAEDDFKGKVEFDDNDNSNHRPIIVADQPIPLEEETTATKTDAYENKDDNYDPDSDSCNNEDSLGMEIVRALENHEVMPEKQIFCGDSESSDGDDEVTSNITDISTEVTTAAENQTDSMLFHLEIESVRRDINDIHTLFEIEKNTNRMIHDQIYTKMEEIDKVNELSRNVYNQHQNVSNQLTEFRSSLQSLAVRLKETEATGLLNKRAIDKQRAECETTCKIIDEKINDSILKSTKFQEIQDNVNEVESHLTQIQKTVEKDKMHYEQRFKEAFTHIDTLQENLQKIEANFFQFQANYFQLKETQFQKENESKEIQSFYIKNQKMLEQRIHKQRVVIDELQLRCDNLESFLKHIDSREREACMGCKEMEKRYYKYDTFLKEVHTEMRLRAAEEEAKFNAIYRKDNERRDKRFEDLRRELIQDATKRYDDLTKKFKSDIKQLRDDMEKSKYQQERKPADLFGGAALALVCMILAGIFWALTSD